MRTITRLAGWTFGWVVANQVALVVILALADGATVPGAVSAWTYAYTFFQLPYGVVAVSVMSAVTPSLSARWAQGDLAAFRHRMAFGLRGMLAIIIPSAVGMLILAHPLIDLVLAHGAETSADAESTAATLAMFALGLPGFCTFLYMVRVLQSMQDTRTAFRLYLVENAINIVLGLVLVGPLGVRGLALSLSIAYTVGRPGGPVRGARGRVGASGASDLTTPVKRVLGRLGGDGGGHGAGRQRVGGDLGVRPARPGWCWPWWWGWSPTWATAAPARGAARPGGPSADRERPGERPRPDPRRPTVDRRADADSRPDLGDRSVTDSMTAPRDPRSGTCVR